MFDRFKRSLDLIHASASVLRQDKHLVLFPIISAVAMAFVVLGFALPVFGLGVFDEGGRHSPLLYSVGFAFYVVEYFVIFYFNAALVGATMIRLDGGAPTLGDGLRIANSRFGAILGYAVIAATVGIVLRMIQERVGFLGRLIVGLLGVGWTLATFLVVPVLVVQDTGPVESIRASATLLKRTWGENVIGQGGLGAGFALLFGTLVLGAFGLGTLALWLHSEALFGVIAVACVLLFFALMLVQATLTGIYSAALYRYANGGAGTPGFDNATLQSAFIPKA